MLGVQCMRLLWTMYRLVHAFRAPSDLVPRDQITVREKHIPTDLVHGLHRKYEIFYTTPLMARSSDNYLIMIKLPKEIIS